MEARKEGKGEARKKLIAGESDLKGWEVVELKLVSAQLMTISLV